MTRPLPGTVYVEGREFIYVEESKGQDFSRLMRDILASCPTALLPQSGGILEEKVRVILHDKTPLLAISYRGDLQGWRKKVVCFCEEKGRRWAVLRNQVLVISDGTELPLADCELQFET